MSSLIRLVSSAVAVSVLAFGSAVVRSMDIIRDGKAVAVIVVKDSSVLAGQVRAGRQRSKRIRGFESGDRAAADVLADWIEKISGVRLKIAVGCADCRVCKCFFLHTRFCCSVCSYETSCTPYKPGPPQAVRGRCH